MHKLKHVVTGLMLTLVACGPMLTQAHAEPHGGPAGGGGGWHGGGGGRGGGGWRGGGGGWRDGRGWRDGGRRGGWGWGGWGGYYSPAYAGWGWGYPGWGWGGGWGWGWGGYYAGAAMGAAAAGASYQAAPEIYNATGNTAPEDDSVYDRDLSTLVAPAAPAKPRPTCQAGQVYNDLTESCDRP